jgi:hypothetical protein
MLARRTTDTRVHDLIARLAEEYPAVPLPEVARVVRQAAGPRLDSGRQTGGVDQAMRRVERTARQELVSRTSVQRVAVSAAS